MLRGIDCNPNKCQPRSHAPKEFKVHNGMKKHKITIRKQIFPVHAWMHKFSFNGTGEPAQEGLFCTNFSLHSKTSLKALFVIIQNEPNDCLPFSGRDTSNSELTR